MTKQDKVEKVMHEWKTGTLTSNGRKVTDYDQAVAIALSEAGLSKYDDGGEFEDADDFIENVKEMHESIDYVVLKDGTKVNGYDIMREGGEMNEYSKGGNVIERRYVNKEEDYETRYAKDKPMRKGYNDERMFAEGGGVGKKLKGYRVDVFTSSLSSSQNVLNGDSYILVTDGVHGDSSEVDSDEVYLKLVKRKLFGKEYVHAEPINVNKSGNQMFGGKFVWSTDSRFREDISEQPIQLHDRFESYAVGGEIGNTVSFKGDYGTPRSGVIKEKRGSSYIVATDDGDRLVDSYEVISFSETPIAKKKRFGFFAGGGEIENKIEKLKKVVSSKMLPESVKAKAQAEIDKLEKELHESKETKAEEKEEHKAGGSEAKEDLIEIAKKMATERGLRPTNIVDELDAIRTISSIMANESGFSYSKVDDLGNNEYIIEIVTFNEEKKKKQAGMVLNKYKDGTYEVAEMQAGKDGNFIKVFGEYKNLKPAVAKLLKGNKQKPMKVIDMRSPSEIAKQNKMTSGSEEKDYIEAKTKALEKSLKDKTISETQRKRDEKELALFKGAGKPEVITDRADVQKIKNSIQEGESILKSGKINGRKLSEGELESTLNSVNNSRAKIGLPKYEAKKPTTRKAPVKKAVAKKAEVKKEAEAPSKEIVDYFKSHGKKEAYLYNNRIGFNKGMQSKEQYNVNHDWISKQDEAKPKADHKKLVAKLKAKKGDKEYDNRASINVKTGERYKRSESSDKKREALPLGKRISEDGNVYYERRLNRADISKKDKFEDGGEIKNSDWGLNLNW